MHSLECTACTKGQAIRCQRHGWRGRQQCRNHTQDRSTIENVCFALRASHDASNTEQHRGTAALQRHHIQASCTTYMQTTWQRAATAAPQCRHLHNSRVFCTKDQCTKAQAIVWQGSSQTTTCCQQNISAQPSRIPVNENTGPRPLCCMSLLHRYSTYVGYSKTSL